MKKIIIILFLVLHTFYCMSQRPICDSVIINTGWNHATGTVFPAGSTSNPIMDPYWQIIQMPSYTGTTCPVVNVPSPSYTIDDLDNYYTGHLLRNSQAISFQSTNSLPCNNYAPDPPIVFERCFTLISRDNVIITGTAMYDDALCITIDGSIAVPLTLNTIQNSGSWPWGQCTNPTYCDNPCPGTNIQRYFPSYVNFTTSAVLAGGDHTIQLKLRNLGQRLCSVKFQGSLHCKTKSNNFYCDPCPNSSLVIRKYLDSDCNGILSAADQVVQGFTFNITGASGSYNLTTDAYGYAYKNYLPSSGTFTISETSALAATIPVSHFVSTSFGTVSSPGVFSFNLNGSVLYTINVLNSICPPPPDACCLESEVNAVFDNNVVTAATYPSNSSSNFSMILTGTGTAYTEVRANMTAFELYAKDDQGNANNTCLQCYNNAQSWASITGGSFPGFTGVVSNYPGNLPTDLIHNPREIVFTSLTPVPIINKSMQLTITLPGKSNIACCHLFAKVTVKISFRDVDCHECEKFVTQVIEIK